MTFRRPLPLGFLALAALLTLAACGKKAEAEPPAPVAQVGVQPAQTRALDDVLVAYGTAEFDASAASTVVVPADSIVSELLTALGAQVRAGQPLLRLKPGPATLLELDKARRDAQVALTERARAERLRGEGLVTEAELQTAIANAAAALALRDSLVARTGGGAVQTLLAPRHGIVDALNVQAGEAVAAGSAALRIATADTLIARLGIEPAQAARVVVGQRVRLVSLGGAATPIESTIAAFDRRVDAQTRLAAVRVAVPPAGHVLPGAALRGEIIVAVHADAVTVPRAALLYDGDTPYLFVADGDHAQRRAIKLGLMQGDAVEIAEGVKAGEPVIVAGNAALEDGMAIREAPASEPDAADAKPGAADGKNKPASSDDAKTNAAKPAGADQKTAGAAEAKPTASPAKQP